MGMRPFEPKGPFMLIPIASQRATSNAPVAWLPMYARREPAMIREYIPGLIYTRDDLAVASVVLYRDEQATQEAGFFSCDASNRPTKASKTVMFNCWPWNLVWLEDLVCQSIPEAHFHRRDYLKRVDARFLAAAGAR